MKDLLEPGDIVTFGSDPVKYCIDEVNGDPRGIAGYGFHPATETELANLAFRNKINEKLAHG